MINFDDDEADDELICLKEIEQTEKPTQVTIPS